MIKGKRVLFADPLEAHSPLTVEVFGQQWMGTSNYEYWGGAVPECFKLLREGKFDQAMDIYWRINSARAARVAIQATFAGAISSIVISGNTKLGSKATMTALCASPS